MGLAMYLEGHEFFWTDWKNPKNNPTADGFKLTRQEIELGYWRKHPDLHGFIIRTFAGGRDECQEIELTQEMMAKVIEATTNKELPKTSGFFFGASGPEDDPTTIEIFKKAMEWLAGKKEGVSKSVIYRASW